VQDLLNLASPLLSSNRISAHPFVPARFRGKLLWHFLRSLCRQLCQWPCGTIGAADDPNSCSIRGSPALWAAIGIVWHCTQYRIHVNVNVDLFVYSSFVYRLFIY